MLFITKLYSSKRLSLLRSVSRMRSLKSTTKSLKVSECLLYVLQRVHSVFSVSESLESSYACKELGVAKRGALLEPRLKSLTENTGGYYKSLKVFKYLLCRPE